MNRRKLLLLVWHMSLIGLLAILIAGPPVARAGTNSWSIVSSPNPGSGTQDEDRLFSVAAATANAVVAVGSVYPASIIQEYSPMIQRWDGSSWSVVTSPTPPYGADSQLYGVTYVQDVDGIYPGDAFWAVGYQGSNQTLTMRSTNEGQNWAVVTSVDPSGSHAVLQSASGTSRSDVWAVGYYLNNSNVKQTLIEHWAGSSWSVVSSPNVSGKDNYLYSVSARASNDAWAVGYKYDSTAHTYATLSEHWDGSAWSIVSSLNPGTQNNTFYGVTMLPNGYAWAVGSTKDSNGTPLTLIASWNGSTWSQATSPSPGAVQDTLWGIAPVSASYIWTVGSKTDTSAPLTTLTERYNGTSWSTVSSPNQGSDDNELRGVAVVPGTDSCAGGDSWAVGHYYPNAHPKTLIERYTIPSSCDNFSP